MKRLLLLVLVLACALPIGAQVNNQRSGQIRFVTSLPATCTPAAGLIFARDAGSGAWEYSICTNTNTFTRIDQAGGGGGTPGGSSGNVQVNNGGALGGLTGSSFSGAALTLGGALTVTGSANASQLVIKGNATQSNANKLLVLQNSAGTALGGMHSDAADNVFIGVQAGENNNIGTGEQGLGNTFIGYQAGQMAAGTITFRNTCIGKQSCKSLQSANGQNTALGMVTLTNLTTGTKNIAIGVETGSAETTGANNVFVGVSAGRNQVGQTGSTFIGNSAGFNNVSGQLNQFFGNQAGFTNSSGNFNTYIGDSAAYFGTTGSNNLAAGRIAGNANTTGNQNVFVGSEAGRFNVDGSNGVYLGFYAGNNLTTGSGNIIIGANNYAASATASNQLTIGELIYGTGLNGALGTISTGNIGIGIKAPAQKLSVAGTIESTSGGFKFPDGTTQTTAASGASAGSGSELQFRSGPGTFGAVTGSSVSGANVTLGGTLDVSGSINAFSGSVTSLNANLSGALFLNSVTALGYSSTQLQYGLNSSWQSQVFGTNGTTRLTLSAAGNVVLGTAALATNATDGFLYLASTPGVPTGTPTANTGRVPLVVDSTNNRLYGYNGGAWQNLTGSASSNFAANVGDGTSTAITVTHNLGTRDVQVYLYEAASPFNVVAASVQHTTTNSVTLTFAVAPTTNQYRVVIR